MKRTNFDLYLEEQLKDPVFAERFERAGEAWDVALQIAALREKAGLSQKELARKLRTSQQQISRLESPDYEGHSLSMLRRVAEILGATVRVAIEPRRARAPATLDAELAVRYCVSTKRLNEQFRRNRKRFRGDFAFQLTAEETAALRSQIATGSSQRLTPREVCRTGRNLRPVPRNIVIHVC